MRRSAPRSHRPITGLNYPGRAGAATTAGAAGHQETAHGPTARSLSTLTPDAKRVYDKITAKRGQMRGGPFASLMHHPALAEKVGDLGEYLRFGGTLPGDIRELAILITARSVNQAYEWVAHARMARTEQLPDDVIERSAPAATFPRFRRV